MYLVTLFRPRYDQPTFVHGVVALFERSADELFIVRHTADFLLVFKGVGMIRVDFGPISETVYIDIILNTIIER